MSEQPNDLTDEPVATPEPEVVVRYRYRDGILLEGNTRPHKDAIKKAWPRWRWFPSMKQWGVPRTRDRVKYRGEIEQYAEGLRKAGVPAVGVDYEAPKPDDVRDFGEVLSEQGERGLERAERLRDRADRHDAEAQAAYEASRGIVSGIPLGQPILVGHHSQRRHENALERSHRAMGRSVEASRQAKRARAGASAAEANVAAHEDPAFAIRRLHELTAEARELKVKIAGKPVDGWRGLRPSGPATGEYLARLQTRQREVEQRTAHYRGVLEHDHVPATHVVLRPGDRVMTERGLRTVEKATAKLVTVPTRSSWGRASQSFARERVWVPRSIVEARGEQPATVEPENVIVRSQPDTAVEVTTAFAETPQESTTTAEVSSPAAPGSLWSVEQEGFALVSPRGEGARVHVPTGHQPTLIDMGKPDTAVLEQLRERERAERRGHQRARDDAAPLLDTAKPAANVERPKATEVDLDALTKKLGIAKDRWPEMGLVVQAFVEAERNGAGTKMGDWFRRHRLHNQDTLAWAHGRARGLLALERQAWPPAPLRGSTYGKDHFRGIVQSLEMLPEVVELRALADAWPERMAEITEGNYRYWFDDGRMAQLARQIVHDTTTDAVLEVTRGKTPDAALAKATRALLLDRVQRSREALQATLDPTLYDPASSPEEVYPKLCKISAEAAGKVLYDVHRVRFDPSNRYFEAIQLCDGTLPLAEIDKRGRQRDAEEAAKDAKQQARNEADARALLELYASVAKGGPVTPLRFNLAYWRAHPEIKKPERPHRSLRFRRDTVYVAGPSGHGMHVKRPEGVTEGEAIGLLFEEVRRHARAASEAQLERSATTAPATASGHRPTGAKRSRGEANRGQPKRARPGSPEFSVRGTLAARIEEDGPDGVSVFSTEHEPTMIRAIGRMVKRGEVRRVPSARGTVAIATGPRWEDFGGSPSITTERTKAPPRAVTRPNKPAKSERPDKDPAEGTVRRILANVLATEGPNAKAVFSPKRAPKLIPAIDRLADRDEVAVFWSSDGLVRIGPGPKWKAPKRSKPLESVERDLDLSPAATRWLALIRDMTISGVPFVPELPQARAVADELIERGLIYHDEQPANAGQWWAVDPMELPDPYLDEIDRGVDEEEPTEKRVPDEVPAAPASEPPTARLEYVDVATGVPADPTELGTLSTGRVVADVDGETVQIDEEDLLGHGTDPDPRKRRYRFDVESPADYPAQARAAKAARAAKPASANAGRGARAGLRDTFDSAAQAAAMFYEHNVDFFEHVTDPWDALRDWMDGIEVRVGKGHRKLAATTAGKRILGERHASRAIRGALGYLFGQAKGRRWEAVPWNEVDRLGEALAPYFEAPSSEPGQRGIYWRPFTGTVRAEDLDAMTPEQREAIRVQESVREIGEQLEQLREAYSRAKGCLPEDVRQVIERRITAWSKWIDDPAQIPGYACEPDPETAGYLCNYPAIAGELGQLRRSCDDAYDPDWAAEESKQGAAGFPDTSRGEDEPSPRRRVSAKACCSSDLASEPVAPEAKAAAATSEKGKGRPRVKRDESVAAEHPRATTERKATSANRKATTEQQTSEAKRPSSATERRATASKHQATPAPRKTAAAQRKATAAERKAALAQRRKAAEERRQRTAAERRAQRLQCSADAARRQAESIDVDSYRRRVVSVGFAVKQAEEEVQRHERDLAIMQREADRVARGPKSSSADLQMVRRRVNEVRCQLRIAQGVLRQRRRDQQRAKTELDRAMSRVDRRQAVADARMRDAAQAARTAKAGSKSR